MAYDPRNDEIEVEVVCPHCDYRLARSVSRLRRDTPVVCPNCGKEVVPDDGAESAGT